MVDEEVVVVEDEAVTEEWWGDGGKEGKAPYLYGVTWKAQER